VSTFLPILPEILLLLLAILLLILDPFLRKDTARPAFLGWFTAAGSLVILVVCILFARPAVDSKAIVFGGMLRFDWLGYLFQMFFVLAAGVTALFFMDTEKLKNPPSQASSICSSGH
jgi:NADH:ubiquinone oxidoreductase subunit 2 (subunit N)